MNIEEIDKWLDNEYGVSYTRLEELHDFAIEQDLKHREEADKEIERLNKQIEEYQKALDETMSEKIGLENIINKAIKYTKEAKEQDFMWTPIFMKELLNILKGVDKE